jgi:hypothetical protein
LSSLFIVSLFATASAAEEEEEEEEVPKTTSHVLCDMPKIKSGDS